MTHRKRRHRGHGEGSIYRRKDGRWAASITVGYGKDGRRRRRYIYGRTRREVAEKLKTMLADQQRGMLADPTTETLGEFLQRWLRDVVAQSTRPKTQEGYKVVVDKHITPALGQLPLQQVSPAHIQKFYADKLKEGRAPAYVRKMGAVLGRALEVAHRWRLIPMNPARLADRPKAEQKEIKVLTPGQVTALLEASRSHRLNALFVFLATTGCRIGEATGLQWPDVNLADGTVTIRQQLQWVGKPLRPGLVPLKTARSRRRIPLAPMALRALEKHRGRQAQERLKVGEGWGDWNLVFTTPIGTPVNPSNFRNRAFYPVLEKASLPRIRVHDLRHFATSAMLHSGADYRTVMDYLGHSQPSVTLGIYAHTLPGALQKAAARVEDLLTAADEEVGG